MKKHAAIFAVMILAVCFLSACGKGTYEEGYADGYDEGYSDAEFEMEYLMEDEFLDGYDIGYDDGYDEGSDDGWVDNIDEIGWFFEEEAVHYAREHSEWHPEEAMGIIEAYQNREPLYDNAIPNEEEYLEAIESLYRFYEYFYCAMYE